MSRIDFKKTIAFFLVIALTISLVPLSAFAEDNQGEALASQNNEEQTIIGSTENEEQETNFDDNDNQVVLDEESEEGSLDAIPTDPAEEKDVGIKRGNDLVQKNVTTQSDEQENQVIQSEKVASLGVTFTQNGYVYEILSSDTVRMIDCPNLSWDELRIKGKVSYQGISYKIVEAVIQDKNDLQAIKNYVDDYDPPNLEKLTVKNCPSLTLVEHSREIDGGPFGVVGAPLKVLTIENCPKVKEIVCENNALTQLQTSDLPALETLQVKNNNIAVLDVSKNPELETLYCENNKISSLNLKDCNKLTSFKCSNNLIKSIDVGGCINLKTLECKGNQLTSLDMSECSSLKILECQNNSLLDFKLSSSASLSTSSTGNQYREIVMSPTDANTFTSDEIYDITDPISLASGFTYDSSSKKFEATKAIPANIKFTTNKANYVSVSGEIRFRYAQEEISRVSAKNIASVSYTGSAHKPKPVLTHQGKTLVEGKDYTLSYDNNTNAGTGKVTVAGKGDYRGTRQLSFTINKAKISEMKHNKVSTKKYTGSYVNPKPTVKHGSRTLKNNADYTLEYKKNIKPGVATIVVKGKGNYSGTKNISFNITYSDCSLSQWYVKDGWIDYVQTKNLMTGYAGGVKFGPNDKITRAQVATILYRFRYPDSEATTNKYYYAWQNTTGLWDVRKNVYYTAAVNWAYRNGIVTGYTSGSNRGSFLPDAHVTREELATMIYRFALSYQGKSDWKTNNASLKKLKGHKSVSSWAYKPMSWCTTKGVLGGIDNKYAAPREKASRAQMAKMMTVLVRDVL